MTGYSPSASQGPSNDELNAVPPDPYLPPFGGSASIVHGMMSGAADLVTGPQMNTDRAQTVAVRATRKPKASRIGLLTRGY